MSSTMFLSKAGEFQIVRVGGKAIYNDGALAGYTDPEIIEFHRGTFVTDDQATVEFLRSAKTYNQEFWEKGNEPGAYQPSTETLLGKIADYAVDHNADGLRDIVATEEESYGDLARQDVIGAAKRALGRLGDTEVGKRGPGRRPPLPKVEA